MRSILPLLVILTTLAPLDASAAGLLPGMRPLWTGVGGGGGPTIPEGQGAGYGHITLGLRLLPVVPELTLREGVAAVGTSEMRQVGTVAAGARFLLPSLPILVPSLRIAFSHQHEAPWSIFVAQPMATLFGTGAGITHRTGFEAGAGLELRLDPKGIVSIWTQANALVYPGSKGPPVTVVIEGGIAFSAGPL